jgi:hypothetical protein
MVNSIEGLEAFIRVIGLAYTKRGDVLIVEYEHKEMGKIGLVIQYEGSTKTVRVSIPTDIEPTTEGTTWLLHENFSNSNYKYAIDYDGFIVVLQDYPSDCIGNARSLKEAILNVVEGYKRLMERVKVE